MKKIILVALALSMCLSLSAQLRLGDPQPPKKKSNTHSSTLIIATSTPPVRESAGWHGVVDFSCGPHVYSAAHKGPAIAASVSGLYETISGFTFGMTTGFGHWTDSSGKDDFNDFRMMAAAGCIIGKGRSNAFFMIQPGICVGSTPDKNIAFTGDVKVGYRYMFNPHIGLVASTGITGTWGYVLAVPITIGFVF